MLLEAILGVSLAVGTYAAIDHAQTKEVISPTARKIFGIFELLPPPILLGFLAGVEGVRASLESPDSLYRIPAALLIGILTGVGIHGLNDILRPNR